MMLTKVRGGKAKLSTAISLMKAVRKHLYEEATMRMAQAFFLVAERGEVALQDIEKLLGVHPSVSSRFVSTLANGWPERGRPGLGVLERFNDPHGDGRALWVRLTRRGDAVLNKILEDIE